LGDGKDEKNNLFDSAMLYGDGGCAANGIGGFRIYTLQLGLANKFVNADYRTKRSTLYRG